MTAVGNTFYFSWEVSLIKWLQVTLGKGGISLISFFSIFGEEKIMILVIGLIYWCLDKKLGKTMGLTVLCTVTVNTMIKCLVMRRRPYFDHEDIRIFRIVKPDADIYSIQAQGYSFPSIHSANAASLYGSLAAGIRKRWVIVPAVVLTLLTGISRVVVGAHYPTDVLAGWGIGILAVFLIPFMEKKIENRAVLYGILLACVLPGLIFCRSEDYFTSLGLLAGFMAGTIFEEKYVNFENTKKPVFMVVRVAGGLLIYLLLSTLLKLPFSGEFLEGGSYASLLVRCIRYSIISFTAFGLYPALFRFL